MRHARSGKKLGRDSAHRKALYANLACALLEHGRRLVEQRVDIQRGNLQRGNVLTHGRRSPPPPSPPRGPRRCLRRALWLVLRYAGRLARGVPAGAPGAFRRYPVRFSCVPPLQLAQPARQPVQAGQIGALVEQRQEHGRD